MKTPTLFLLPLTFLLAPTILFPLKAASEKIQLEKPRSLNAKNYASSVLFSYFKMAKILPPKQLVKPARKVAFTVIKKGASKVFSRQVNAIKLLKKEPVLCLPKENRLLALTPILVKPQECQASSRKVSKAPSTSHALPEPVLLKDPLNSLYKKLKL